MSQRRLPAEIYWRRRLLLLAVVIAVVWGVLQLTGSEGDDEPKAAPTPTKKAGTPTASPTPTVAPLPAVQTEGPVDVALVSATKACDPTAVRITPTVKPAQLTKGPVDIGLVVSSTETSPCTLQADDAQAVAVISANGTPVWDSTVCKAALLTAPVQISPGWATLANVQWTGRGSGSHCTTNERYASAGKYTVQIGTLGGEPGKTTFTLDPRPEPAPTTAPPADPAAPAFPATPGAPTPQAPVAPGTPADPGAEPPVTPAG